MKTIIFLFFVVINLSFSQQKYEYLGVLKLNGNAKTLLSYRIVFVETKGLLSGFSVTDLGGEHETKNKISGTYNRTTKQLNFKEEAILYTKSPLSDDAFCFVNFTGKVKLTNDAKSLSGDFKGLFQNKTKCIDGTIDLVGIAKIEQTLTKLNTKIQKSKKIDQATKDKVNPMALLDSLKVNSLTKNQNLNLFVESSEMEMEIWDAKIEDGDRIDLFHNGRRILSDYEVTNKKKIIKIKLAEDKNQFRIEALNEGERTLNTAMIRLIDQERNFELTTNLKKGEKTSITIVKK